MENYSTDDTRNRHIECLEVSIPKRELESNGQNLLWTLSVYSLDNEPQAQRGDMLKFRIMVYDWKKSIERLLNEHKISYLLSPVVFDTVEPQPTKKVHFSEQHADVLLRAIHDAVAEPRVLDNFKSAGVPVS